MTDPDRPDPCDDCGQPHRGDCAETWPEDAPAQPPSDLVGERVRWEDVRASSIHGSVRAWTEVDVEIWPEDESGDPGLRWPQHDRWAQQRPADFDDEERR